MYTEHAIRTDAEIQAFRDAIADAVADPEYQANYTLRSLFDNEPHRATRCCPVGLIWLVGAALGLCQLVHDEHGIRGRELFYSDVNDLLNYRDPARGTYTELPQISIYAIWDRNDTHGAQEAAAYLRQFATTN
jgi:hypothetical protein